METIFTVIHIIVALFLVVIVLLQQGKGADMGATFGGSSQTVFGSGGPMPLLNKVTTAAAVIFMVTSVSLAYLSAHKSTSSVMENISVQKPLESAIERAVEALPDQPLIPADPEEASVVEVVGDGEKESGATPIQLPAKLEESVAEHDVPDGDPIKE
jgi:preprotein translocase subunit SecG